LCEFVSRSRAQLQSSRPFVDFEMPYPGITGRLATGWLAAYSARTILFFAAGLRFADFFGISELNRTALPAVNKQG
jgi:hypothetical protein